MRLSRSRTVLTAVLFGLGTTASAQDSPESPPPPSKTDPAVDSVPAAPLVMTVARKYLKNFLTDVAALAPYKSPDGSFRDFDSAFMIGTPGGRFAIFWDPETCRILGVLDIEAPPQTAAATGSENKGDVSDTSPYPMLAEGAQPFGGSTGAHSDPDYFGFRIVEGRPAFLYTCGSLVIEERLWLENGGEILKQMFTIREPKSAVSYAVPESWKERAEAPIGEWEEAVLTLSKEEASEFTISYRLDDKESKPGESN